jgi:hypothetical protein
VDSIVSFWFSYVRFVNPAPRLPQRKLLRDALGFINQNSGGTTDDAATKNLRKKKSRYEIKARQPMSEKWRFGNSREQDRSDDRKRGASAAPEENYNCLAKSF